MTGYMMSNETRRLSPACKNMCSFSERSNTLAWASVLKFHPSKRHESNLIAAHGICRTRTKATNSPYFQQKYQYNSG